MDDLIYEFGPYNLDLSQRILTRNGETISLGSKATEVLVMLVSNAGDLVGKDELLQGVWPNTFVEEANLAQHICVLRRALGDDRVDPRFIKTVTGRGYRFVASVRTINGDGASAQEATAMAHRPVVAVLPLLNSTGDPELEYLADGITDNLINNLSRLSKLRVMSHSTVSRYKVPNLQPQRAGEEMGASAVLVGRVQARRSALVISVELVEVSTGWQLWGESFDSDNNDILEIQDAITRQLLSALKLKLTGEEEKEVTARYTENAEAYQSYLEGRYYWSRYTRTGIEKAIGHFRKAIDLDPNYALAYAAIVDCYLRLATNYLPPEDEVRSLVNDLVEPEATAADDSEQRVRLRFEWDWKGVERELRRATELKTTYPSAHQWYAAYMVSKAILKTLQTTESSAEKPMNAHSRHSQLFSSTLSPNEEAQIFCAITREQIEIGNYDAGCLILTRWWTPGEWPTLQGLSSHAAGDLLFTTGALASCLSSTGRIPKGQKHAEDLLSGSTGIFEHLGAKRRSAECRIELALSLYRQGLFALSKSTLLKVLGDLQLDDTELRSLALIRLAVVERHSGQVSDSLSRFSEAHHLIDEWGALITGRYYHEFATALEEVALANNDVDVLYTVIQNFQRAFKEFVAVGHHRYAAVVKNNHGFLLVKLGRAQEAEPHLLHARRLFETLNDVIRKAQVNDTLARLYLASGRLDLSDSASQAAVACLEQNDEEALLAEALTTRGTLLCKLKRYSEAREILDAARHIAERCGDFEGAGLALLVVVEEMYQSFNENELRLITTRLQQLLQCTQATATRHRVENCLRLIEK